MITVVHSAQPLTVEHYCKNYKWYVGGLGRKFTWQSTSWLDGQNENLVIHMTHSNIKHYSLFGKKRENTNDSRVEKCVPIRHTFNNAELLGRIPQELCASKKGS